MARGSLSRLKEVKDHGCGGCNCKTLEEELYWKHIKSLRFCVVLGGDFQQKLPIPKKFADNMRPTVLHQKMTLRGPSGASWDVLLIRSVDGVFLQDGWEEFVKAFMLKENDILFFKYDRHSSFDVKIFDGECEKEASYFVKKCEHVIPGIMHQKKRVSSEILLENDDDGDGDGDCVTTKKARVYVVTEPVNESQDGCDIQCRDRTSKKILAHHKAVQRPIHFLRKKVALRSLEELQGLASYAEHEVAKQPDQNGPTSEELPSINQNPLEVGESCPPDAAFENVVLRKTRGRSRKPSCSRNQTASDDQSPAEVNESCPRGAAIEEVSLQESRGGQRTRSCSKKKASADAVECYKSNRRPITEQEKREALKMASERLTDKSFFVVMRAYCCYKCFLMTIPANWAAEYLGPSNRNVILRVGEKTWSTRFTFNKNVLALGWKQFALENHLEEFDVCLFKLVSRDFDTVMLDVTIFRVVKEVTPPTLLTA